MAFNRYGAQGTWNVFCPYFNDLKGVLFWHLPNVKWSWNGSHWIVPINTFYEPILGRCAGKIVIQHPDKFSVSLQSFFVNWHSAHFAQPISIQYCLFRFA